MITIVLLYAVLAATFTLAKKALLYSSPCFLIGFRMILAGACLLGYRWKKNLSVIRSIKPPDYLDFFTTALFLIYFAFVLEFWALQYLTTIKVVLIYSLTPFITALIAYFMYRQRLTSLKILGITMGTIGLIPVLIQGMDTNNFASIVMISLPEVVLLASVFSASFAWFQVKNLMNKGYHFTLINGISMLIGGILSMGTSFVVEGLQPPVVDWWNFLLWVGLLIIFANLIFYNMYGWLLQRYSTTMLSFAGFLCPVFATIFEWLFGDGTITWHYVLCLVMVISGLYLFYRDELRNPC